MALGNANLKTKILCFSGKCCLYLIAVLHILLSAAVITSFIYLFYTWRAFSNDSKRIATYYWIVPAVLALVTSLGTLFLICIKKQFCIAASIIWPVLIFLLCSMYYGSFVYKFSTDGLEWTSEKSKIRWDGTKVPLLFVGALLLPFACHCLIVLSYLGCGTADEEKPRDQLEPPRRETPLLSAEESFRRAREKSRQKRAKMGIEQPTPRELEILRDHSQRIY